MDQARACIALALMLVACGSGSTDATSGNGSSTGTNSTASGAGGSIQVTIPDGGAGGSSNAGSSDAGCGSNLTGVLRDFHASPPEFEGPIADDRGMVEKILGSDGKPVYAGPAGGTATTSGISTYDNQSFFPIDGELFGNEGNPHNFHFTFELHTTFVYKAGDTFRFRGDDDLWLFVNKQLVIDLGGVHAAEEQAISLDQLAPTIGLTAGGEYAFDLFYNERHTTQSEIEIQMTLVFKDCGTGPR